MQPQEQVRRDIGMKPPVSTVGKKPVTDTKEPKKQEVLDGKKIWEAMVPDIKPLCNKSDFGQVMGVISLALKQLTIAKRNAVIDHIEKVVLKVKPDFKMD